MRNVIVKKEDAVPTSFSVHAEGDGIAVGYTDSFSPTINLFLSDGTKTASRPRYFNLIIGYDPFEKDYILVDKSRALTEYITDEVKNEFCGWSDEVVEKIKKLPAIITMELRNSKHYLLLLRMSEIKTTVSRCISRDFSLFRFPF